mmetsp:Transcript_104391/g.191560  ORF Transcript_104391/g.191560 Transcript_104391/m.191560 type:complete len:108 (+) Transcript_104391:1-324(+)
MLGGQRGTGGTPFPESDAGSPFELQQASADWARHIVWSSMKAAQSAQFAHAQAAEAVNLAQQAGTQVRYIMEHPCLRKADPWEGTHKSGAGEFAAAVKGGPAALMGG